VIQFILHLYLLLFPRCEMMVSFLHDADFVHCNDDDAHREWCYANSDWDYGGAIIADLHDDARLNDIVFHLPFVRTVSCWK